MFISGINVWTFHGVSSKLGKVDIGTFVIFITFHAVNGLVYSSSQSRRSTVVRSNQMQNVSEIHPRI